MTPEEFVPLHCHSHFSILDGFGSPDALAKRAKELGHKAVALTDHGECGGLYSFQKACKAAGIKPILGMESYFCKKMDAKNKDEPIWHLTLLAKNKEGYANLIGMSSDAYTRGFYKKPRIDMDELRAHSKGIIVLSGCAHGVIAGPIIAGDMALAESNARAFMEVFGEDFYFELMVHDYLDGYEKDSDEIRQAMKAMYDIAKSLGGRCVFTYDSHYPRPADADTQDMVLSINTKNTIKNPLRLSLHSSDFYMQPMERILTKVVPGMEDLLKATAEIAAKVEDSEIIAPYTGLLPSINIPPGVESEERYLEELIRDGMIRKGLMDKPEYRARIRSELEVIFECGFARYFLVLWDLISYARRNGIRVGPGRGSGVASLCLYALDVTALDPIEHDLLFSRFLNPSRISPPDVDVDFDFLKTDKMFEYVSETYGPKYGDGCTVRIGTYGSMKAKDALKKVGKALDIGNDYEARGGEPTKQWKSGKNTLDLTDAISKCVPEQPPDMTIELALKSSSDLQQYAAKYPKLFEAARKVERSLTSHGTHAAGIVVCNRPIKELVPIRETKGVVCTQYNLKEVEDLGLLKFDFLALKTLSVMELCLDLIKERHGKAIDVDQLKPTDKDTFELLNSRDVDGVFQFEGDGISKLLAEIHVDSFSDMVVGVALYRPGAISLKEDYCDYKHGRRTVSYMHPKMRALVGETYGIMVYQEQVMKVSREFAGFTEIEADKLRKAMGKKDKVLMAKVKDQFVKGCIAQGHPKQFSSDLFDLCEKFGGYGFNKAHAAAYAYLAYQTAWLKCHYRAEYMCSLLTFSSSAGDEDKRIRYEGNAKDHGMVVLPADINLSSYHYVIEKQDDGKVGLRMPLTALKGVGEKVVREIVHARPFADFQDFVIKTMGKGLNSGQFEALADAKCMTCWGKNPAALKKTFEELREKARKEKKAEEKYIHFDGGLGD